VYSLTSTRKPTLIASMRASYGLSGWCRIDDDLDLPGPLYVRLRNVGGNVQVSEIYVDGRGEAIKPAAIRNLPLRQIEEWIAGDYPRGRLNVPGPDLSRLASSHATIWGRGTYAGRHCDECGGPVKRSKPHPPYGEQALTDWVALSWYAQYPGSGIPQSSSKGPKPGTPVPQPDLPRLDPPAGTRILSDDYLLAVKDAYAAAVANGLPPAKTLAPMAGVDVRTIHRWVSIARSRGLMDPPTKMGRPA
jgi:hypothetical protein